MLCVFLIQGWMAVGQPCFSRQSYGARDFDFPFRLTPPTVAPGPETSRRCSVSSALPRISLQRERFARSVSARASPDTYCLPEAFLSKAQLCAFGGLRAHPSAL